MFSPSWGASAGCELIKAIVDVMRPGPGDRVCDPACGTGGFLLSAIDYVSCHHGRDLDPDQKRHLREGFVHGWELVPATARLCIMNLYLHGINADPCPVRSGQDSLAADPGDRFSMVLTNPPFGRRSSIQIVNEEGDLESEEHVYERQDFWTATKNPIVFRSWPVVRATADLLSPRPIRRSTFSTSHIATSR